MFKNNLKIAIRNLTRQKIYSIINVLGLAVGIASCLLIVLFVKNEFSYDKYFKDSDRIYRMALERIYPNHSTYYAVVPHSFEGVAKRDFPEIEHSTNAFGSPDVSLVYKNEREEEIQFDEELILAVDSSFFKVFDFELILGNRDKVLTQANEIVVTQEFAKRYFNDTDPIGKIIRLGELELKVSGLCKDVPENSHFKFSALVSSYGFPFFARENFTSFSAYTYFKLKEGSRPDDLEAKIPGLVDVYAAGQIERELGKSWAEYRNAGNGYRYFLQPLKSIHLYPQYLEVQMKAGGNITSVYILIFVAILILSIACINFMNLSTARSAERSKEVGLRKVMGSARNQLISQFLVEAFLLSVLGVFIAVAIVYMVLPFFNELTERNLQIVFDLYFMFGLLLLTLFVGFLAGLYPAFVLSSFNPVVVMKGKFTGSKEGKWIRNGLVVFQFWISIILIISTLVIAEQMKFMQEKSLGFDKEQVLLVERGFNIGPQNFNLLIEEVKRLPEVSQVAGSFAIPGRENNFFGLQFQPEGSSEILTAKSMVISDGLAETLGLELLEGRWFSEETNDSLYVVLNEQAVKTMGIENPIGTRLMNVQDRPDGSVTIPFTVIGVVKDFNFISLRNEITPLVLQSNELFGGIGQYIVARIKPGQLAASIQSIETKWKEIVPAQPFKFSFLDENLERQYQAEQQTGKLFTVFAVLAIFVACIGLFALSAYITSLRTKEIGVRKVLGASVSSVVMLLSKDFTKMILIAFLLASPVAWYVMEHWWLQHFAYRVSIGVWIFVLAGIFVLTIAWITVSFQSVKAAISDPVKSLKYE
jgi:putative ABC transport system permease protein